MSREISDIDLEGTHRVLANVMESDWSIHFIGPDGQTRVGPWLLMDSHDDVRADFALGWYFGGRTSGTRNKYTSLGDFYGCIRANRPTA